ncbi:MAG: hypothetical protein C0408_05465 [Odoribacter sp.]|nr:hypothetical protein [Odoribacter sp.]
MIKNTFLIAVLFVSVLPLSEAQVFIKTADLFRKQESEKKSGYLNIIQEPGVDTLISRYILANKVLTQGVDENMEGYRVLVYRSSNRNARDESNKIRAEFMIEFPDIPSYAKYAEPGYFLVRAGNFRTKLEGTKWLYRIRRKYPNAYLVPDLIYYPDLIKQ